VRVTARKIPALQSDFNSYNSNSAAVKTPAAELPALLLFMAISSHSLFSLVLRHLGSFTFSTARHLVITSSVDI